MKKIMLMMVCLLSGCSMNAVTMYDGGALPRKDTAVVTVMGGSAEKQVSLRLTEVDGKEVPGSSNFATYEVQLKPGKHQLKYLVWGNVYGPNGNKIFIDVNQLLVAGHTYAPDVDILEGRQPKVWLVDKGENYPVECNHSLLLSNKYPKEKCK